MLLLTPGGEVRDFSYVGPDTELALSALWAIAQRGHTVLSARLTDETGTYYLDLTFLNDSAPRQAPPRAAGLLIRSE